MKPRSLKTNRLIRFGGFLAGVVLFYAPFQFLLRGLTAVSPTATAPTAAAGIPLATSPLGAPLLWFAQPWQWPAAGTISLWWLPIVVLPAAAIIAGPLFCGWLCPAGALPELLGRLVPDRFKFDIRDRVDILPVRLGFLVGYLVAPWASAFALSHFTGMSDLVGGLFANSIGLAYFTWTGLLFTALWIIPFGLFTKGGRGWCMFLCPVGTVTWVASAATARLPLTSRIRVSLSECNGCGTCAEICPTRALSANASTTHDEGPILSVEHNLCNECLDCTVACPNRALRYGRA